MSHTDCKACEYTFAIVDNLIRIHKPGDKIKNGYSGENFETISDFFHVMHRAPVIACELNYRTVYESKYLCKVVFEDEKESHRNPSNALFKYYHDKCLEKNSLHEVLRKKEIHSSGLSNLICSFLTQMTKPSVELNDELKGLSIYRLALRNDYKFGITIFSDFSEMADFAEEVYFARLEDAIEDVPELVEGEDEIPNIGIPVFGPLGEVKDGDEKKLIKFTPRKIPDNVYKAENHCMNKVPESIKKIFENFKKENNNIHNYIFPKGDIRNSFWY